MRFSSIAASLVLAAACLWGVDAASDAPAGTAQPVQPARPVVPTADQLRIRDLELQVAAMQQKLTQLDARMTGAEGSLKPLVHHTHSVEVPSFGGMNIKTIEANPNAVLVMTRPSSGKTPIDVHVTSPPK